MLNPVAEYCGNSGRVSSNAAPCTCIVSRRACSPDWAHTKTELDNSTRIQTSFERKLIEEVNAANFDHSATKVGRVKGHVDSPVNLGLYPPSASLGLPEDRNLEKTCLLEPLHSSGLITPGSIGSSSASGSLLFVSLMHLPRPPDRSILLRTTSQAFLPPFQLTCPHLRRLSFRLVTGWTTTQRAPTKCDPSRARTRAAGLIA